MIKLTKLEYVILEILRVNSWLYGLQIDGIRKEKYPEVKAGFFEGLYSALRNLEARDFIESRWSDEGEDLSDRGGLRRRYYRITGSGRKIVEDVQNTKSNEVFGSAIA